MFILDTDHISLLEWGDGPIGLRLAKRIEELPSDAVVTTIISFEEQTRGWLAFQSRARTLAQQVNAYRKLKHHLDTYREIIVLEFDTAAAAQFQRLKQSRIRIGTMDLKIAAITLTHDATLLSRNLPDFRRVPELKVEDWTSSLLGAH